MPEAFFLIKGKEFMATDPINFKLEKQI